MNCTHLGPALALPRCRAFPYETLQPPGDLELAVLAHKFGDTPPFKIEQVDLAPPDDYDDDEPTVEGYVAENYIE